VEEDGTLAARDREGRVIGKPLSAGEVLADAGEACPLETIVRCKLPAAARAPGAPGGVPETPPGSMGGEAQRGAPRERAGHHHLARAHRLRVARRVKGTPQEAIRILKRARDVAQPRRRWTWPTWSRAAAPAIGAAHVVQAAERLGIDKHGLDRVGGGEASSSHGGIPIVRPSLRR
jgi:hypothetical protein